MTRALVATALLVLAPMLALAEAEPDVRVFTTSFLTVRDPSALATVTYRLDEVDLALAGLGASLPNNFTQAESEARQRLNSPRGAAAMKRMQGAFEGLVVAWSHGVERLPAILINDRYLIYGVRDVDEALQLFAARVP